MNKEEIIKLAKESGCEIRNGHIYHEFSLDQMLKRFAKLVAENEREACAKICDKYNNLSAYEIRQRGQHD